MINYFTLRYTFLTFVLVIYLRYAAQPVRILRPARRQGAGWTQRG